MEFPSTAPVVNVEAIDGSFYLYDMSASASSFVTIWPLFGTASGPRWLPIPTAAARKLVTFLRERA